MLQTAIDAALKAGRLIADRYPQDRALAMKGVRDLVTDTDTASEALILGLIRERFPGHAILSEEAGGADIGTGCTWVVDPLDGTTNYAHHHPTFAVSIGVLEDGVPQIGVIYDPLREHLFLARKSRGATLNGAPIQVSRVDKLSGTLIGFDWGHSDEARERSLLTLQRVLPACGTLRSLGSAALALAYVASGWLDAYFQTGLKPWDVAAGMLLVEEAGGRCSTFEGGEYRMGWKSGCLASNGLIHEDLMSCLLAPQGAGRS